jgi:hypothetical protein
MISKLHILIVDEGVACSVVDEAFQLVLGLLDPCLHLVPLLQLAVESPCSPATPLPDHAPVVVNDSGKSADPQVNVADPVSHCIDWLDGNRHIQEQLTIPV